MGEVFYGVLCGGQKPVQWYSTWGSHHLNGSKIICMILSL